MEGGAEWRLGGKALELIIWTAVEGRGIQNLYLQWGRRCIKERAYHREDVLQAPEIHWHCVYETKWFCKAIVMLFLSWYQKRMRKHRPHLVRAESLRMECLRQFPCTELTPMQDSLRWIGTSSSRSLYSQQMPGRNLVLLSTQPHQHIVCCHSQGVSGTQPAQTQRITLQGSLDLQRQRGRRVRNISSFGLITPP